MKASRKCLRGQIDRWILRKKSEAICLLIRIFWARHAPEFLATSRQRSVIYPNGAKHWKRDLRSPQLAGDERANLLLAKAEADEITNPVSLDSDGKELALAAFSTAQSDRMRFAAIYWLTHRYTLAGRDADARACVENAFLEIHDRSYLHQLQVLNEQMATLSDMLGRARQHLADKAKIRLQGELEFLQNELVSAAKRWSSQCRNLDFKSTNSEFAAAYRYANAVDVKSLVGTLEQCTGVEYAPRS